MKIATNFIKQTKRHLSASGSILLPLALKWRLVTVALCALAVSALPTITPSSVHAASLTISIPKNPLTVNVSANSNGGFSTTSGTLKVSGDAAWGYTLTVKSGNEDKSNNLTTADGKNNILQSITEKVTTDASSNNFPNNSWGYMPSKLNSISNSQYLPGPTSEETTIDKTNTATDATGTTYDFTLAAKVDATQPAGLYSGSFTFTAIANYVNYNITYDCKSGSGCSSTQTGTSTEKNLTLNNTAPTREGYKFLGYCTTDAMNEKRCIEAKGTIYKPNSTYPLTNSENTVKLIAMWEPTTMQTFGNYCNALEMETDVLTLKDVRDNKEYTVAKLKDGLCWMTQNLAIGSNEKETILKPETSDVEEEFILPRGDTAVGTPEEGGWHHAQFNTKHIYINPDTKYGGYYTWFTATAGEGTLEKSYGDTQHSVCPKGWRLPIDTEIGIIASKYNATTSLQNPANYTDAGRCDAASCPRYTDVGGDWWSSSAVKSNSNHASCLSLGDGSSDRFALGSNWKGDGFSVRCVSRNE